MLSYFLKYRKKTKNPKVVKTENGRMMLLSKCAMCNSKKLNLLKSKKLKDY